MHDKTGTVKNAYYECTLICVFRRVLAISQCQSALSTLQRKDIQLVYEHPEYIHNTWHTNIHCLKDTLHMSSHLIVFVYLHGNADYRLQKCLCYIYYVYPFSQWVYSNFVLYSIIVNYIYYMLRFRPHTHTNLVVFTHVLKLLKLRWKLKEKSKVTVVQHVCTCNFNETILRRPQLNK